MALQKEEKSHDDRMQQVNNKIKAASELVCSGYVLYIADRFIGQAYEKKVKKKATDAADEHAKYMNLLTVVGPEMAQDKQCASSIVLDLSVC